MDLNEFYQSTTSFWNTVSPILFAHMLAFLVLRWILGNKWSLLKDTESLLKSDRYIRWKAVLDEFELRSKLPFLAVVVFVLYIILFRNFMGIINDVAFLSMTYSETELISQHRPLDDLVELASYSPSTFGEARVRRVLDIKDNYLEIYREKYPDRYQARIGWISNDYYQWHTYYHLSLLFLTFLVAVAILLVRKRNQPLRVFIRLASAGIIVAICVLFTRYQSEQYIEYRLQAELSFVINQLELDQEAQTRRLTDAEIATLREQLYDELGTPHSAGRGVFWLSSHLEAFHVPRRLPTISVDHFKRNYSQAPLSTEEVQ